MVRAEDLLLSTARQVLVIRALLNHDDEKRAGSTAMEATQSKNNGLHTFPCAIGNLFTGSSYLLPFAAVAR